MTGKIKKMMESLPEGLSSEDRARAEAGLRAGNIVGIDVSEDGDRTAVALFGKSRKKTLGGSHIMDMPGYALERVWSGKRIKMPVGVTVEDLAKEPGFNPRLDIERTLDYLTRSIFQAMGIPAMYMGPSAEASIREEVDKIDGVKVKDVTFSEGSTSVDVEVDVEVPPEEMEMLLKAESGTKDHLESKCYRDNAVAKCSAVDHTECRFGTPVLYGRGCGQRRGGLDSKYCGSHDAIWDLHERTMGMHNVVEGHKRPENNRERVSVNGLVRLDPVADQLRPGDDVVFISGQHVGEVYDVEGVEMEMNSNGELGMRVKLVGIATRVRSDVLAKWEGGERGNSDMHMGSAPNPHDNLFAPNQWHYKDGPTGPVAFWIGEDGRISDERTGRHSKERTLLDILGRIKEHERGLSPESSRVRDFYISGAKGLVRHMLSGDGVPFKGDGYSFGIQAMITHIVGMVAKEDDNLDRLDLVLNLGQLSKGDIVSDLNISNGRIISVSEPCVVINTNDGKCVAASGSRALIDPLRILFRSRPGLRACPNPEILGVYNWGEMAKLRWTGYFYKADYFNGEKAYFTELDTDFVLGVKKDIELGLKVEDGIDEAFVVPYEPPAPIPEPSTWDPYGLAAVSRPCPEWPEGGHPARRILEKKER